tara:strand:- start:39 stop:320 length:282 start_codon:yes stop_codon:yes gene_type:complete
MKDIKVIGMEEDRDILSEAFDNGYRYLFEGISMKRLKKECEGEGRDLYITFYVDEEPGEEDMYDMLLWYEDEEWYERCGVIKRYMDKNFRRKH